MEDNEKELVMKSLYMAFETGCAYAKGGRGNTSLWTDYVGKGWMMFQKALIEKNKNQN